MKHKILHLLWVMSVLLVMVAPAFAQEQMIEHEQPASIMPQMFLAQVSSGGGNVSIDLQTLLNIGYGLVLLAIVVILVARGNPRQADAALTQRLKSDLENRDLMAIYEKLHQERRESNALYKMAFDGLLGVVKLVAPLTKNIESDDALRDWLSDMALPGKPSVSEVDDEILVPTPDDNPHRDLAPFSAVNQNPTLEGEPTVRKIPEEAAVGVDQRILASPPYYNLLFTPNAVPWVHHKVGMGYEFGIEWLVGTYGFMYQPGVTVYEGDYLIKLVADCKFNKQLDNFEVGASVTFNNQQVTTLNVHPLAEGVQEYVWAIRFTKFGVINFDTWIKSAWAVEGGKVIVQAIRLETLPENSGYTTQIIG